MAKMVDLATYVLAKRLRADQKEILLIRMILIRRKVGRQIIRRRGIEATPRHLLAHASIGPKVTKRLFARLEKLTIQTAETAALLWLRGIPS